MRLLMVELKKVWRRRIFAICLAVLASVNLFLLYTSIKHDTNAAMNSAWKEVNQTLFNLSVDEQLRVIDESLQTAKAVLQIQDLLTQQAVSLQNGGNYNPRTQYPEVFEKYGEIYANGNYHLYTHSLYQEVTFLTQMQNELALVAGYRDFLDEIQIKADRLSKISIFNNNENSYDQESIKKVASVYGELSETPIKYAPQKGLITALNYPFTDLLLIAAMLFLAHVIVRTERDSGLLALIRSTPGGRLKTAVYKLITLAICLLIVLVVLYGVNLLFCQMTFGLGSLERSVQSVPLLMRCTFQVTVGEYLLLFLLAKWAGAYVMGLWVMVTTLFCRRAVTGWCAGLSLPALHLLVRTVIPATSYWNVIKYANLVSLLKTNELLGAYRSLYWFGHPVSLSTVEAIAAVIYGGGLICAFCVFFCKAALLPAPPYKGITFKRKITKPTTVFKQEARKFALINGAVIALVSFASFQIVQAVQTESYLDADEIYYQYYMTNISGKYDREAYDWLLAEYKQFEPLRKLDESWRRGEITREEYQMQTAVFSGLQQKRNVFERVVGTKLAYIQYNPGAWLIYETGWEKLFCFSGNEDLQDSLYVGIICCVCFAGFFSMERKGSMQRIIVSTPLGRGYTVKCKLIISAIAAFVILILILIPRFMIALCDYGLPEPFAPAMSIPGYESMPSWVTLSDVVMLMIVSRFVAIACIASCVLAFSLKLSNTISVLFVGMLIFCLPQLMALSGLPAMRWVGLYPLFHICELLKRPSDYIAGIMCLVEAAAVTVLCWLWLHDKWAEATT